MKYSLDPVNKFFFTTDETNKFHSFDNRPAIIYFDTYIVIYMIHGEVSDYIVSTISQIQEFIDETFKQNTFTPEIEEQKHTIEVDPNKTLTELLSAYSNVITSKSKIETYPSKISIESFDEKNESEDELEEVKYELPTNYNPISYMDYKPKLPMFDNPPIKVCIGGDLNKYIYRECKLLKDQGNKEYPENEQHNLCNDICSQMIMVDRKCDKNPKFNQISESLMKQDYDNYMKMFLLNNPPHPIMTNPTLLSKPYIKKEPIYDTINETINETLIEDESDEDISINTSAI
jgi:hypothetical protein